MRNVDDYIFLNYYIYIIYITVQMGNMDKEHFLNYIILLLHQFTHGKYKISILDQYATYLKHNTRVTFSILIIRYLTYSVRQ